MDRDFMAQTRRSLFRGRYIDWSFRREGERNDNRRVPYLTESEYDNVVLGKSANINAEQQQQKKISQQHKRERSVGGLIMVTFGSQPRFKLPLSLFVSLCCSLYKFENERKFSKMKFFYEKICIFLTKTL